MTRSRVEATCNTAAVLHADARVEATCGTRFVSHAQARVDATCNTKKPFEKKQLARTLAWTRCATHGLCCTLPDVDPTWTGRTFTRGGNVQHRRRIARTLTRGRDVRHTVCVARSLAWRRCDNS